MCVVRKDTQRDKKEGEVNNHSLMSFSSTVFLNMYESMHSKTHIFHYHFPLKYLNILKIQ